ncbi:hypothetical protein [Fontivita pretiosa]|uniref:pyroglutamyl-peptidase I family protein n=1 Tax=Fontivita pretiosa TaxID=2989684 RepID=UPI003D179925
MRRPRLLITGFQPFDRYQVNPSGQAAEILAAELGALGVAGRVLPVDFHAARSRLLGLIDELRPQACLCTGLAPGDSFRLERIARKVQPFEALPGEAQLRGNWPWESFITTLDRLSVPWRFSDDCGLYVCEGSYWTLLDHASRCGWPECCGFVHVPAASEQFPVERTVAVMRALLHDHLGSADPPV